MENKQRPVENNKAMETFFTIVTISIIAYVLIFHLAPVLPGFPWGDKKCLRAH